MDASPLATQITNEHRTIYERDGVVCLRGAFSYEWLAFLSDAVEEAIVSPAPHAEDYVARGGSGRFFGDIELSLRLPEFRRFVLDSPAAEIAGRIMGASRVNFFFDQLLVKQPGTSERTQWHQDQPSWAISGYQVCSVWLPLDPVLEEVSVELRLWQPSVACGLHLKCWEFCPQISHVEKTAPLTAEF